MSRPRRPYGNPPGRLPSTMLKVLAAELSDGGRLARGKELWAADAVIDIVVGHGAVTAEVQGSRPQPYIVTIEAEPGGGVPRKAELWLQCTCPDDPGTGSSACKHGVAALFALADEVAIEPDLLDRWRAGRRRPGAPADPPDDALPDGGSPHDPLPDNVRLLRPADRNAGAARPPMAPPPDPTIAQIAGLLAGAGAPPTFPVPAEREHRVRRGEAWGQVFESALAELRQVRWD